MDGIVPPMRGEEEAAGGGGSNFAVPFWSLAPNSTNFLFIHKIQRKTLLGMYKFWM